MPLLFLSAAIVLGYEIIDLLNWGQYFGELKYVLLNAVVLGLILFIFKFQFNKTKFASFITRHNDSLIRLSIVAFLQAAIILIIFVVRSI
jgi:hypothetical protein